MPRGGVKLNHQAEVGRRTCAMCRLRKTEPLRAEAIENRLALGEGVTKLAREYGIDRRRLTRHWANHCDQKAILRRVHQQERDIAVEDLLVRAKAEGTAPMVICDRQIPLYISEFETARQQKDREARDAADRRLFAWVHLKHRMLQPLQAQFGPQVTNNVRNNVVVTGLGTDFAALVARMEQRLALRPRDERRQFIALLREVAASDAQGDAALGVIDLDAAD
jgi:hypothetical protein